MNIIKDFLGLTKLFDFVVFLIPGSIYVLCIIELSWLDRLFCFLENKDVVIISIFYIVMIYILGHLNSLIDINTYSCYESPTGNNNNNYYAINILFC